MNDEQLVQQFQMGQSEAFDELLNRYQSKVLDTCFRYLNNEEEARDAAQEVFVKLYLALPRFKPKARFSTWLYRIAVNHSLNLVRSKKRRGWQRSLSILKNSEMRAYEQSVADESESPEEKMQTLERRLLVRKALATLSEAQRTAVVLHRYEGLSYKEIADVMKTSVSSVESRLFRAKQNLYKILKAHF